MAASPIGGLAVVLDATEAQVKFAIIAGRFENYAPVLSGSVLTTLREMEALHFDTEGDISGKAWAPLAPSTLRAKERAGFGNRPAMVRTGELRNSLTKRGGQSIVKASAFGLLFGTRVSYAEYHQQPDGYAGIAGRPPQRQLIPDPLPAAAMEELHVNIRDYLIEGRIRSPNQ